MNDIKLIYFEGCPEAKNVRAALLNAGINDFQVIKQNELLKDDSLRKLSSPSILKGEELIYGIRTNGEISSCTFDSINFTDEIRLVKRLRELESGNTAPKRNLHSFVGSFFSTLLVLKCPACIPALVGFLSSLGLSFLISQIVLKSVLIAMLLISLAGLLYSYNRHKNILPLILGVIFSVVMYVGRFHYLNQVMLYMAITGLIITSLWDYRLKTKKQCPACI